MYPITDPPPISKKCETCKIDKLLVDFDPSKRSKDLHKSKCKECCEKKQKKKETERCTCDCEMCSDNKLFNAAASIMELITNRIIDGVDVSDEFKEIIAEMALAAKVSTCKNCKSCEK